MPQGFQGSPNFGAQVPLSAEISVVPAIRLLISYKLFGGKVAGCPFNPRKVIHFSGGVRNQTAQIMLEQFSGESRKLVRGFPLTCQVNVLAGSENGQPRNMGPTEVN